MQSFTLLPAGDLEEVHVGVPEVHGRYRPGGPRAPHGSFDDLDSIRLQVLNDLGGQEKASTEGNRAYFSSS